MTSDVGTIPADAQRGQAVLAVSTLYAAHARGQSERSEFLAWASVYLHAARTATTRRVVVALALLLTRTRGYTTPVARTTDDYSARDAASMTTILDDADSDENAAQRLERFAVATLGQYARDEIIDAAAEYGAVGWRWRAGATACPSCSERNGREFGLDEPMLDHPNCDCYPEPIFEKEESE